MTLEDGKQWQLLNRTSGKSAGKPSTEEVRTAIADAVQQAVHVDIDIEGHVFVELDRIETSNDYILTFVQGS